MKQKRDNCLVKSQFATSQNLILKSQNVTSRYDTNEQLKIFEVTFCDIKHLRYQNGISNSMYAEDVG